MRTLRLLALLLALALPAAAQGERTAHFAIGYDVGSDTMTFCVMQGQQNDPWGGPFVSNIPIDTAGSSTSVSAVTATTEPFARLEIGDAIFVQTTDDVGARELRWITAKADDDNVTVNAVIDLTAGYSFQYLLLACGTDAASGWIKVESQKTVTMTVIYEAGDLGALEVIWEGRDESLVGTPVQIYPGPSSDCGFGTLSTDVCSYTSTGDVQAVKVTHNTFSRVRLGLRHDGTDGGTRESVHAMIVVR